MGACFTVIWHPGPGAAEEQTMSAQIQRQARHGFTLVELLVVVAIISVLMALLVPALSAAKDMANRSTCANNLKQIGLASMMYGDDYKGIVLPGCLQPTSMVFKETPRLLYENGYLKDYGVFRCPTCTFGPSTYYAYTNLSEYRYGGYGANLKHIHLDCNWGTQPLMISRLKRPASLISFAESAGGRSDSGYLWVFCPDCGPVPSSWCYVTYPQALSERHQGNNNTLYVDSHVKANSYASLIANKDDLWGHLTR